MSPPPQEDAGGSRRDTTASLVGAVIFAVGLGIASVAVPLLALRVGYSTPEVGVIVAISAVSQMGTRLVMGAMMRRLPDKVFVVVAAASLALSCGVLVLSTTWLVIAVSQLLQGLARACFWTGTQTHAVRTSESAVGALARINLVSGLGQIAGPLVAGLLIARSPQFALGVAGAISATGVVAALLLARLAPFAPRSKDRTRVRIWLRPGVDVGCWAGASAGAWRGLLGSYVPVALDLARQSSTTIGALVAVANGAQVAGSAIAGRLRGAGLRRSLVLGILASGIGIAVVGPLAGMAALAGLALFVSGIGAGAVQTVGPAVATDAVDAEERGDAIASTGTFRAAALLVAPFAVAGMVTVIPLTAAIVTAGLLITAPAVGLGRLRPAV
ncbi:Predicted arabinose efflux permease, MFS family [Blastococcus aggregatus]|uniref:Predicted arabinose efflux permease, MFS family n=1 Tax=Blastococcus aggregatus TaxID=38502 RepID=A0A285VAH6_9ACTN|nr:MFS transporter [Blastococcus aggregatus]SOC49501.1 Predicted arabinose efflux permease, MFS family [Blastococcus aggregatus]